MWINTPRRLINTSSRLEVSIEHTPLPKWLLIHTVVPSALPCTSLVHLVLSLQPRAQMDI